MIHIHQLCVKQDKFLLSAIEWQIDSGEYAVLMGQTGCGKTSLLEAICGLRRIAAGQIFLDHVDVTRWSPQRRNIGYVPQDAVLFPGMRVDRQIEFPLEIRRVSTQRRRQRVQELAELLEIGNLLKRMPDGLSGGERQRVALARAISFAPKILCLDEPLSALDESTHARMLTYLKRVHQTQSVTVLHITHNATEAQQLATQVFQLSGGQLSLFAAKEQRIGSSKIS